MQQQDLKAIGGRIKTIRKTTKKRHIDFSEDTGLTVNTISRVENGHAPPPQKLLDMLSNKLGYNIDWILTGSGPELRGKGNESSSPNVHAKVLKIENELKEMKKMLKELMARIT
jgi:transcriptional regulator with XRE-family HTH domain